jgi:serine protease Do
MNRNMDLRIFKQRAGAVILGIVLFRGAWLWAAEPDVRRDAVVNAIELAIPSVANISTATRIDDPYQQWLQKFLGRPGVDYSLGSGVIIDENGYILTNDHVVRGATEILVTVNTNAYKTHFSTNVYRGHMVASSGRASDLALVKIDLLAGEKLKAVKFAREDDLLLGETVIALGNPFGLGGSVSRGILSSKARRPVSEKNSLDLEDWLQTDAAINPGNSGGPLINLHGELIGINVAVLREENAQGIGFAIPIKRVNDSLSQIFTEETKQLWFGARVRPGTETLAISAVQPGSPAEKAGLRAGDSVLQIGEQAPKNFVEFYELINQNGARDINLVVARAGERRKLVVHPVPEETVFNADLIRQKIGATVQEIPPELARNLQLTPWDGLIIAGIEKGSPAAEAQLLKGYVIRAIDGLPVPKVIRGAKLLQPKKKGEGIRLVVLARVMSGNYLKESQGVVELKSR